MERLLLFAGLLGVSIQRILEPLAELGRWLIGYGPYGLFAIAFLDSAMLPLPSGPDLVMMTLSAIDPSRVWLFAFMAAGGSMLGCTLMYLLASWAGTGALSRVGSKRRQQIERLLARYGALVIVGVCILPPPFPFKPFVLTAGILKIHLPRFIGAIFVGRSIRFLIEGWLAIEFGDSAPEIFAEYGIHILVAIVLLVIALVLWRWFGPRARPTAAFFRGRDK